MFASGTGSNFKAIVDASNDKYLSSRVSLLISNNSDCGAAEIARKNNIDFVHISRKVYPNLSETEYSQLFIKALEDHDIDLIVLAGYMKLIVPEVLKKYKGRIINIHPALLPAFGGKGMYGLNVHKAVIESGEKKTGITIHYVDENYDDGEIIFQECIDVDENGDAESLQKKVLKLEHKYYPEIIKRIEEGNL